MERAAISQVGLWWNKSLLWDSSSSRVDPQFYGNFREKRNKKGSSSEVFDSIITEFKKSLENVQLQEKKFKIWRQKRMKPNWW